MEYITNLFDGEVNSYFETYGWVLWVFLAVFTTMIASVASRRIFNTLAIKSDKTELIWDNVITHAARKPVRIGIWVIGLYIAINLSKGGFAASLVDYLNDKDLISVAIVVLVAWFFVRFIKDAELILQDPAKQKKPMDPTTAFAVGKLVRLSIIITTALGILPKLGFQIGGVLAFGGIGGMAIGFAAKDLLANFFGGLMIYLDRPFKVGDWIRSPDQNIEGTVEHIGWRLTQIRRFDKRPLYVPNATFTNISVENPSRMTHRRVYETFGVRYEDASKLPTIVAQVKQMLIDHEDMDTSQTLIVNINEFNASSVDFFVYSFTKTTNWIKYHEVKQDVLMKVMKIIEDLGGEFAFPTQTIHIDSPQFSGLTDSEK